MMSRYNVDDFSNEDLIQHDFGDADVYNTLEGYTFEEEDDSYLTEIDRLLEADGILDLTESMDDEEINPLTLWKSK